MFTLSKTRNAVTLWSAAMVTSLMFISTAVGPLPVA